MVIHPRASRRGGPLGESERLDVLDFLARVLDPVPEPRQQQVRYWGWYSNAVRGKRRKAAAQGASPRRRERLRGGGSVRVLEGSEQSRADSVFEAASPVVVSPDQEGV